MNDTHFEPQPTPEQLEEQRIAQEAEATLARKIRREVLRVERGEADEDIARDEEEREQEAQREKQREEEQTRKRLKKESSPLWQLLSGNILVNRGISRYYRYLIAVAIMLFFSIFSMFYSLHLDMHYSNLSNDVQLLRERHLRLKTERYQRSSISAIERELKRRGIVLEEVQTPSTLLED
ncbi:MAG: FtsL-like putative cell division protein [Rikenellaceae bacterium]